MFWDDLNCKLRFSYFLPDFIRNVNSKSSSIGIHIVSVDIKLVLISGSDISTSSLLKSVGRFNMKMLDI